MGSHRSKMLPTIFLRGEPPADSSALSELRTLPHFSHPYALAVNGRQVTRQERLPVRDHVIALGQSMSLRMTTLYHRSTRLLRKPPWNTLDFHRTNAHTSLKLADEHNKDMKWVSVWKNPTFTHSNSVDLGWFVEDFCQNWSEGVPQ